MTDKRGLTELEQQIVNQAKSGIAKAISEALSGYDNPLKELAKQVISDYSGDIKNLMAVSFEESIKAKDFQAAVKEEFKRKTAKLLVSQMSGQVEKAANVFKQDATLKARMIVAIESMINEHEN